VAGSKEGSEYLLPGPEQPRVSSLRITYRTALVLEAIAREPGVSNLDVARRAQINDQGQVSKLLSRLERNGLAQNTGRGQARGAPNEWRLTPAGQELEQSIKRPAHNNEMQAA
jgi:DNA-binding MarR family transcriptional regulator